MVRGEESVRVGHSLLISLISGVPVAGVVLLPFAEPAAEELPTENVEIHREEAAAAAALVVLLLTVPIAAGAGAVNERLAGSVVLASPASGSR